MRNVFLSSPLETQPFKLSPEQANEAMWVSLYWFNSAESRGVKEEIILDLNVIASQFSSLCFVRKLYVSFLDVCLYDHFRDFNFFFCLFNFTHFPREQVCTTPRAIMLEVKSPNDKQLYILQLFILCHITLF